MDQRSCNKTKTWRYRLRYIKSFKKSKNSNSNTSQISVTSSTYQTVANIVSDENSTQLRKNGNSLQKSFRKWHTRMKNCFSKSTRPLSQIQTISIVQQPASPNLTRESLPSAEKIENTYSLDPFVLQRNCRSPASDQNTYSNQSSVTPSPSRLTQGSESENRSLTPTDVTKNENTPKNEVSSLAHCVWYWGPATKAQVDARLHGEPDGSFLVRDSASDRHIFSISFRSVGLTLHARIEYSGSGYKLFDHEGYATVKELIEKAMEESENGLLCYTQGRREDPNYPVRLLKPVSRYDEVRSLQNLSRFVIRQHVNLNDIDKLSLPTTLINYLKEDYYFS